VGPALLKGGVKELKTAEGVTLVFHGVDRSKFREIIDKSNIVFITLP
jgi:hypothetical protein